MKRIIAGLVLVLGFMWITTCQASACGPSQAVEAQGNPDDTALEAIVSDITQRQGVKSLNEIDCSKLSQDDLERVGEALMSTMHPDQKEHQFMDEMMGGEGSESLRQAHIRMGQAYLNCQGEGDTFRRFRGVDMMTDQADWAETGRFDRSQMMMPWNRVGVGFGAVLMILVIAYLVSGTAYFIKELIKR